MCVCDRVNYHLIFLYVDVCLANTINERTNKRINGQKRGNRKIVFQAKIEKEEFKNKKKHNEKKNKTKIHLGVCVVQPKF